MVLIGGFGTVIIILTMQPTVQMVLSGLYIALPLAIIFSLLQIRWFEKRLVGARLVVPNQSRGRKFLLALFYSLLVISSVRTAEGAAFLSEGSPVLGIMMGCFLYSVVILLYVARKERLLGEKILLKET